METNRKRIKSKCIPDFQLEKLSGVGLLEYGDLESSLVGGWARGWGWVEEKLSECREWSIYLYTGRKFQKEKLSTKMVNLCPIKFINLYLQLLSGSQNEIDGLLK